MLRLTAPSFPSPVSGVLSRHPSLVPPRAHSVLQAKAVLVEMVGLDVVEQMEPALFNVNGESGSAWEACSVQPLLAAAGIAADEDGIEEEMFRERVRERLLAQSRHPLPCKGARSLVAHLEHHRIPMAVATNCDLFSCECALTASVAHLKLIPPSHPTDHQPTAVLATANSNPEACG